MMNKFRGPDDVNFTLVSGNLKEIADHASRISQAHTTEDLECLQCLTSNYREDKDRNERRVPGTCEWFLKHSKFLSWRQTDSASLLWVSADPGCGKSVLSRALVDEGLLSPDNRRSSVCYFFFKDDDANRQSGANALCAILHQLFVPKPLLLRHAKDSYQKNGKNLRTMFKELWDILLESAADPEAGEIICVLDALDECKEPARKGLITQLSWFNSAQDKKETKLKFLATSRPYYDIERSFNTSIDDMSTIRLKGEYESEKISIEIDLVIDHQVPRISESRNSPLKPEVQNALIKHLKEIPHRTYLWLHFILEAIRKSLDSTAIRLERLIERLPRTIEDAYEKILAKVNGSDFAEQTRRLLHIIVAAARPLTLQEMNIALAIDEKLEREESCQSYNELDLESEGPFRDKIRNLCGLFISIIDSKIYLIHQTAREFLVSQEIVRMSMNSVNHSSEVWRQSLNPVESNSVLAKICLSYLLFHELNRQVAEEVDLLNDTIVAHEFLDYAAKHWANHCRQARIKDNKSVLQSTLDVCDTQSNRFQRWFGVYWQEGRWPGNPRFPNYTDLMIASYLGLEATVKLLVEQDGVKLSLKNNRGWTALSYAAYRGHAEVVKVLLKQNDVDIHLKDSDDWTALFQAAENGHTEVVQLLLEKDGVKINLKDYYDQTPLLKAAKNGHAEVVKLLLEQNDVELNLKDRFGQTALSWAADYGHTTVFQLLLEKDGVEINLIDHRRRTPLSKAAKNGHCEIVRQLLNKEGVEVNSKDLHGLTALEYAKINNHDEIVSLLERSSV